MRGPAVITGPRRVSGVIYDGQEADTARHTQDGAQEERADGVARAIWASYSSSDELRRALVDRRYKACERYIKTSMALNISERSYYALLDDFRMSTALAAVLLGLLGIL